MNRIKGVGVAEGFKLNRPKNREKRKEKKRKML